MKKIFRHGDTAKCSHCHLMIEFRTNIGDVGWYHYCSQGHVYYLYCRNVKAEPAFKVKT